MTGDLQNVRNNKLRKLLSKDPKFREVNNILWEKTERTITEGLNDCTDL